LPEPISPALYDPLELGREYYYLTATSLTLFRAICCKLVYGVSVFAVEAVLLLKSLPALDSQDDAKVTSATRANEISAFTILIVWAANVTKGMKPSLIQKL